MTVATTINRRLQITNDEGHTKFVVKRAVRGDTGTFKITGERRNCDCSR